MFEAIMSVFIGYCIGRSVKVASTPSRSPDAVLEWDKNILGYRPIPQSQEVKPGKMYYICYEVKT